MKDIVLPHKHNNQEVPDSIQKELGDIEQFQMIAELFKQLGTPPAFGCFGSCATARNVSSTFPPCWICPARPFPITCACCAAAV